MRNNALSETIIQPGASPTGPLMMAPAEEAIAISYQNTRPAGYRCEIYCLFHEPYCLLGLGLVGLLIGFWIADTVRPFSPMAAFVGLPGFSVVGVGVWTALLILFIHLVLQRQFLRPGALRRCNTALTPRGIRDETPDKVIFLPWSKVCGVVHEDGDLFFWSAGGTNCYIPREAFHTRDASLEFYEMATLLWLTRGASWLEQCDRASRPLASTLNIPGGHS